MKLMKRQTERNLIVPVFAVLLLFGAAGRTTFAQTGGGRPGNPTRQERFRDRSAAPIADPDAQVEGARIEQGPVTLKLERGGKLSLGNTSGPITIVGSERDTVEARATGSEPVGIRVYQSPSRPVLVLSVAALSGRRVSGEARLDVKVPRYAEIEMVDMRDGEVDVSDVDGAVVISGRSGEIRARRLGALQVHTISGEILAQDLKGPLTARTTHGEISVDSVQGPVEIATTHGEVTVKNAASDVKVNSASGEIDVRCAKGRVEAITASGSITLVGIGGDVEANTASGEVFFKGAIRANGRYRLKSVSGEVEMAIQDNPPGFTATLVTYNGEVETVFPLKVTSPLSGGSMNRRIAGTYGDGKAELALDSFNGAVRIIKLGANATEGCK